MNEIEQKKTVKEFRTAVGEFKAGMRAWKRHMQVLVKHTNALLQLHIAASQIPEKQIENLASNEDTYREIGEIHFEARIKANQPETAGWLATANHCHKLARARVTKGKKTLHHPQTKEWLPMTPYEQQVLVKEPEVLEQTAVYRNIKKQTTAQAMEAVTSPQQPNEIKERGEGCSSAVRTSSKEAGSGFLQLAWSTATADTMYSLQDIQGLTLSVWVQIIVIAVFLITLTCNTNFYAECDRFQALLSQKLCIDIQGLTFNVWGGRRNNLVYIAPSTLIHTCGNSVQFLDLVTKSQTNLPSVGGDGIGCIAVHPSKAFFAVCEKGNHPNVYIYNYPTLTTYKVLKLGTEEHFTAAAFNFDGSQLATVGGHPDYWLTVWDWTNESIVLQSKAFSQDVFQVSFSRHFLGQLVTSGIGHIRFWKMANTFTGPKLEGLIGKFGQVPLSDICAFVELPDGKVLSGTETGMVLVWDGGLIKCQLRRPGGMPCHNGMIEFLQLDEKENEMLTAGADGCVRFWSLQWLDAADDGDEKTVCEVNPLRELHVDDRCSIKGIIVSEDHWLIQHSECAS
ncbi:hypothetical protein L7F22_042533 [Adiantum nelumboides]|nr:hypothetical protein [Adiantum nelumboides]